MEHGLVVIVIPRVYKIQKKTECFSSVSGNPQNNRVQKYINQYTKENFGTWSTQEGLKAERAKIPTYLQWLNIEALCSLLYLVTLIIPNSMELNRILFLYYW